MMIRVHDVNLVDCGLLNLSACDRILLGEAGPISGSSEIQVFRASTVKSWWIGHTDRARILNAYGLGLPM
jgi:hypothetical protein